MAIVGEKITLKLVGVGALDDPPINKTISPINQNLKRTRKARPYDKLGLTLKNPSKQKKRALTSPQHL